MPRIPRPRPKPHPRPPAPVRPVKPPMGPNLAHTISQLPVFRLIAGSAVGVAILNWWNAGTDVISETLGVDEQTAMLILGCGVAACLAIVIAAVLSAGKRREVKTDE